MARKMRKFSAGGAQGKYDRRMADIEKDFKKDSAGKSGRALEVLEAKAAQRKADAEDDRAKRMGTDRTATRAAERAAESNLTKTRKYGAPKAVTTEAPAGKVTDTLGAITAPKSGLATAAKKPVVKKAADKPSVADTARSKFFQDSLRTSNFKAVGDAANARQKAKIGASNVPSDQGFSRKSKILGASTKTPTPTPTSTMTGGTLLRGKPGGTPLVRFGKDVTNDPARAVKLATLKKAAEAPGATAYAKDRYKSAVSSGMYAKGGAVKKENAMKKKSTPPQPTAAERAADAKFRASVKNLKVTPAQGKVIDSANRSEGPGYKKGGKAKGKPFAATKFGAALMKKSADTKGRAMPKFAKGGSIDGCAVKGKTKATMVKMARGGAAKMRGRDSYGGAEFKNGGSC